MSFKHIDVFDKLLRSSHKKSTQLDKKTQSLIQASMKLGEAVYKSQQKTDGKPTDKKDNKDNKDKDNVVDAEVVDPKEDKEKRA